MCIVRKQEWTTGNDGDYYLRTDTGGIYFKASGTWGTPIVTLTPTT